MPARNLRKAAQSTPSADEMPEQSSNVTSRVDCLRVVNAVSISTPNLALWIPLEPPDSLFAVAGVYFATAGAKKLAISALTRSASS